ncbi:hypothetical protein Fot_09624 [Forsythia ovata]|uniref:Uncharacterized protein n=1 Tax=Forsythia ovata TaxID=205694 RepID=A0ABD1WEK5_9LAMI
MLRTEAYADRSIGIEKNLYPRFKLVPTIIESINYYGIYFILQKNQAILNDIRASTTEEHMLYVKVINNNKRTVALKYDVVFMLEPILDINKALNIGENPVGGFTVEETTAPRTCINKQPIKAYAQPMLSPTKPVYGRTNATHTCFQTNTVIASRNITDLRLVENIADQSDLKRLKGPLKLLNKREFSHIAERAATARNELTTAQLNLHDQPKTVDMPWHVCCFTDWFDGLQTFIRYICHKSWLGGWFMPQKKTYFALQLPKGWWVFGLDLALHCDIDVYQFKFFLELIKEKVSFLPSKFWLSNG